jgi:predicted metalloprotease
MNSPIRPSFFVAAALLLLVILGGAWQYFDSARASDQAATGAKKLRALPPGSGSRNLILGSDDGAQPANMEQFLTAVTKDVDSYWMKVFENSGLPEPRVGYMWIPAGQTAASACGDESGTLGDSAAAYCAGDDTIYISQKFATDIYNGALDHALPGSSQGYGRTIGDFSVAYIVAHEYGHEVQDELGLFQSYGQQLPTMAFELQADCYAGTWANSAYRENRLEDGDVQEALDAALAVGDFDTTNPGHHGTPEQREQAWKSGFQTGDPAACSDYLDPANLGDAGAAQQDQGYGPYGLVAPRS